MASSLARLRQSQKRMPEKIQLTYKQNVPEPKGEHFPMFTKDLYMSVFPAPIPDRRKEDDREADYNDFLRTIRHLGTGRMGKTALVARRDFVHYAATKTPKKDFRLLVALTVMDVRRVEYVEAVRAIEPYTLLDPHKSPFLCRGQLAFRSRLPYFQEHYYFVSEFYHGGSSLCKELQRVGKFSERDARFYFMEIADALISVHSYGKIIRRLCLCNVLLEPYGHVRLAMYSLCDQNLDCGQPCNMLVNHCGDQFYASPEIVFGVDVQAVTDWWSLGVILYQLITGTLPFTGRTLGDLGKAITEGDLYFPSNVSGEALCLIKNLLHKDPRRRFGFGSNGQSDIMKHPFFSDVHWADIRGIVEPPIKPKDSDAASKMSPEPK